MKLNDNVIDTRTKNLPSKRTINLIGETKKKFRLIVIAPSIIIFILAAAVFSKFFIIDRFVEVYKAQEEVADMQVLYSKTVEKINSFGDLVDIYAHYTYADFTAEELTRADRVKVLNLVEEKVNQDNLLSLSMSYNQCVIQVENVTLGMAKDIAADLEASGLVDFCIVTNANTGNDVQFISDNQIVVAQITIKLNERGYE